MKTSSGPRFREAVAEAKGYAERGHKLAPQSHVLLTSLGMLCDLEGDHERARDYFRRRGELGIGPYWRLHASTSWGLEGKYTQALTEIEKAVLDSQISPCTTRSTKGFEIEFRALLTDGAQEVRFERLAVGST